MTDDEFADRLGNLERALIDAQTVRHERAIYNKMFELLGEYNNRAMFDELAGSIRYKKFLMREEWQNTYDWLMVRLPKPLRWIARKLQ